MIPIVSICNLVSGLFFSGITLKLYFTYRKTKNENIWNFFISSFCLTLVLLLLASPGLVSTNLKIIGLVYAVYPSLALLSFIYFGLIPLRILEWRAVKQIFFWGMVIATISITTSDLINFGSAVIYYHPPYIYWESTRDASVNISLGITLGFGLLSVMIFFLLHALKSSEKYVRLRSFLIVGALIGFALMVFTNFVFGASAPNPLTSVIASILGILSGFLLLSGVLYKTS